MKETNGDKMIVKILSLEDVVLIKKALTYMIINEDLSIDDREDLRHGNDEFEE